MSQPEPWLRGPIEGVPPHLMPLFHSFQQVREDLATHLDGVTVEQLWREVPGIPPLGFQLRHMAGSVDRLTTYLMGGQLSVAQVEFLKHELEPGATFDQLMLGLNGMLDRSLEQVRTIPPDQLGADRFIGKKQLPSTVRGLLVHIAEHTQRHLGQAITTAKVIRAQ